MPNLGYFGLLNEYGSLCFMLLSLRVIDPSTVHLTVLIFAK